MVHPRPVNRGRGCGRGRREDSPTSSRGNLSQGEIVHPRSVTPPPTFTEMEVNEIMEHDLIQPEYENEYESDGGDFLDELIERGIEYVSCDKEVVDDLGRGEVKALYNEMYRLEVENMRLDHLNFDLKIKYRNYETDLRITTRPVFARVLDLSCFLKETITEGFTVAVDTWKLCVDWFRYNHPLNTYRWWLEYRYNHEFEDGE